MHTIGEVARRTGLSAHTLRWYERIGLLTPVGRAHTGQRRFTERDISWLEFLGHLRLTGMPVAGMRRYAELVRAGRATVEERRLMLEEQRARVREHIAELQAALLVLDHKIERYAEIACELEQEPDAGPQHTIEPDTIKESA